MAKGHKPRAGSRAFWPKKRAKRIYPRFKNIPDSEQKPLGFAAYKAGMTRVSFIDNRKGSSTQGQEIVKPVTVLDCPPLVVAGIKFYKHGYRKALESCGVAWADNLNKDLNRKTKFPKKFDNKKLGEFESQLENIADIRLLVHTRPRDSGFGKKKPELFELPLGGDVKQKFDFAKQKLGSELKIQDAFSVGDEIDASAVSKGKGFQGVVKRFGVKIRSRKNKGKRRHVGTLGSVSVARVIPAKLAMPGQLGFQTRTEYNKRILKLGTGGISPAGGFVNYGVVKGDYVLVEGSLPGPKKRLVLLRKGVRARRKKELIEVKDVFLESQQG